MVEKPCTLESIRIELAVLAQQISSNQKHADAARDALRAEMVALFKSAEAAIKVAEITLDKFQEAIGIRFESVNEFRASLADQAEKFVTKAEYEVRHKNIEANVDTLLKKYYTAEAKESSINGLWVTLVAMAAVASTLISGVLNYIRH